MKEIDRQIKESSAAVAKAQNELASIFQEQESVNTEIETKETEIAENNEQEQQQVQEITDSLWHFIGNSLNLTCILTNAGNVSHTDGQRNK